MFPEKARHWITGPYQHFYFDSWKQWLENSPYTKKQWVPFTFLYWNIKDSSESRHARDTNTLQFMYSIPDGDFTMKIVYIIVATEDEPAIREWFRTQSIII